MHPNNPKHHHRISLLFVLTLFLFGFPQSAFSALWSYSSLDESMRHRPVPGKDSAQLTGGIMQFSGPQYWRRDRVTNREAQTSALLCGPSTNLTGLKFKLQTKRSELWARICTFKACFLQYNSIANVCLKRKDTKSRCQVYPGVRWRVTRTGPGSSLTFQPPGSATPAR